jgi:hypothetical protein
LNSKRELDGNNLVLGNTDMLKVSLIPGYAIGEPFSIKFGY